MQPTAAVPVADLPALALSAGRRPALLLAVIAILNLAACATVQHGPVQRINVDSDPPDALVIARFCGPGSTREVRTPGVVWVSRRAERCTLTFHADGYEIEQVVLSRKIAEEYFDNLSWLEICADNAVDCDDEWLFLLGGVFAGTGFGVDAVTGALFQQQPEDVFVTLYPLDDE